MVKESESSVEVRLCPLPRPLTILCHDTTLVYSFHSHPEWTWFLSMVSNRRVDFKADSPLTVYLCCSSLSCVYLWSWTFVLLKFSIEINKSVWTLALHREWVWSVTEHWFITDCGVKHSQTLAVNLLFFPPLRSFSCCSSSCCSCEDTSAENSSAGFSVDLFSVVHSLWQGEDAAVSS